MAYRAYDVGQWQVERSRYGAPGDHWTQEHHMGRSFQDRRGEAGRGRADDSCRAAAEFVIGRGSLACLPYPCQYGEDFGSRVLTTTAVLN